MWWIIGSKFSNPPPPRPEKWAEKCPSYLSRKPSFSWCLNFSSRLGLGLLSYNPDNQTESSKAFPSQKSIESCIRRASPGLPAEPPGRVKMGLWSQRTSEFCLREPPSLTLSGGSAGSRIILMTRVIMWRSRSVSVILIHCLDSSFRSSKGLFSLWKLDSVSAISITPLGSKSVSAISYLLLGVRKLTWSGLNGVSQICRFLGLKKS